MTAVCERRCSDLTLGDLVLADVFTFVDDWIYQSTTTGCVLSDFVSRSPSDPPCFSCVAFSISRPDATVDSVYVRLAWVRPKEIR